MLTWVIPSISSRARIISVPSSVVYIVISFHFIIGFPLSFVQYSENRHNVPAAEQTRTAGKHISQTALYPHFPFLIKFIITLPHRFEKNEFAAFRHSSLNRILRIPFDPVLREAHKCCACRRTRAD